MHSPVSNRRMGGGPVNRQYIPGAIRIRPRAAKLPAPYGPLAPVRKYVQIIHARRRASARAIRPFQTYPMRPIFLTTRYTALRI